jgi:hypothetical protein
MPEGFAQVDPASGQLRPLGISLGSLYLDWSPDGKTLYGMGWDSAGRVTIEGLSLQSGKVRLLAYADNPLLQGWRLGFAVGNDRFYFPLVERKSDVWVAELESQ